MRCYAIVLGLLIFCLSWTVPAASSDEASPAGEKAPADTVSVGYDMAEAGLDWLDLVAQDADAGRLRAFFFDEVAPTAGCQAIIAHWARFRDWDEAMFYDFILEALGLKPTDAPLVDADGHPTGLGHARRLWSSALANRKQLRADLAALRDIDLRTAALTEARRYLPAEADVTNHFHVVLFGASNAFSVGNENGLDLLQLKRNGDGSLDVTETVALFAHEMHHSGLSSAMTVHMGNVADDDHITLPGVLIAEGMATYFITPPGPNLERWRASDDPMERQLAADWDRHAAALPELYAMAATDIGRGLDGSLTIDDLVQHWLGGMQGPAYALGTDMMGLIDRELGRETAIGLSRDSRLLLETYNRAARSARKHGEEAYLFPDPLAARLAAFPAS